MQSARAGSPRKPSMRRAACDSCRAQKLRCVKIPEDAGKCKRCQSTGAECHYSAPRPSGRPCINQPPQELPEPGEGRIGRPYCFNSQLDGCTGRRSKRDYEQLAAPGVLDRTIFGIKRAQPTPNKPNDAELGPDVLQWPVSWPQNLSVSTTPTFMPATPDLPIPGISDNDLTLPSLPEGEDPMVLDGEYGSSIPPVSPSGQSSSELELPTQESLDDVRWFLDAPDAPLHSTHFHHSAAPAPSTETRFANAFHELNVLKCDDPFQISRVGSAGHHHHPGAEDPSSTSRYDWMQQLSELNMRVHQFLTRSAYLEQEVSRTDRPIEFPTEFAGQVVELSSAFLRLVGGTNNVSGGVPSVKRRIDDEEENGHGACSTFETDSCNARQESVPQQSSLLALTEMSTVLQLLAIYLSLQKIHYLLYTAAYYNIVDLRNQESISRKKTSKPRCQTVFTGLHLGGVPLEQFATFQVKFVVEVASHLLGEVEHLLGLPDGCRISRSSSDQTKGILGVSASPHLLRMVLRDMRSPLGDLGGGYSPVQATKDRLSQLKELFRGSVSI